MTNTDLLFEALANTGIMEKSAAPKPGIKNLIDQIRALAGGEMTEIGRNMAKLSPKGSQGVVKSTSSELKKLLQQSAKDTSKVKVKAPDVLNETLDVMAKTPGKAAPGAAVGAGAGGIGGAMIDTDVEDTNIMGMTKKRPGSIMDKLKNIGMGAMAGAAVGGGARARSIAAGNIENRVGKQIAAKLPGLGKMGPEEVLALASDKLSPKQVQLAITEAMARHGKDIASMPREQISVMRNALNSGLDSSFGASNSRGMLENAYESVVGAVGLGPQARARKLMTALRGSAPEIANKINVNAGASGKELIQSLSALRQGKSKLSPEELQVLLNTAEIPFGRMAEIQEALKGTVGKGYSANKMIEKLMAMFRSNPNLLNKEF